MRLLTGIVLAGSLASGPVMAQTAEFMCGTVVCDAIKSGSVVSSIANLGIDGYLYNVTFSTDPVTVNTSRFKYAATPSKIAGQPNGLDAANALDEFYAWQDVGPPDSTGPGIVAVNTDGVQIGLDNLVVAYKSDGHGGHDADFIQPFLGFGLTYPTIHAKFIPGTPSWITGGVDRVDFATNDFPMCSYGGESACAVFTPVTTNEAPLQAEGLLHSINASAVAAPEMSSSGLVGAVTLLLGSVAVIRRRSYFRR